MSKVKDPSRVRLGEKISYFLINLGNIPVMMLLSTFFLIFYTDVVGLDAGKIATLFLISKIMDGISDPVMGYLLDRFPVTKLGKFRPIIILGAIICGINYILLWFGAVWLPVGKYVVVYVSYLLLGWTFDIMDIPTNGLMPVMTADLKEKNTLSIWKMVGLILGGMIVSISGPIIVAGGTLKDYYLLIFLYTGIMIAFSVIGALGVKERVPFAGTEEEKYTFKEMLGFLVAQPVMITFLASLCYCLASFVQSGANSYFFTYIMGDLALMAGVSGVSMVGMLPGLFLGPVIANKTGKKKVYTIGLAIASVGFGIRILAPTSLPLAYIGTIVAGLGGGMASTLMYAIQADNTLYIQHKTGKRVEAAIASLSSFITKVGQGVAGAIPGYVLAATGFQAGAQLSAASHSGIIACVIIMPAIFAALGAVLFGLKYKLTKEDVERMSAEVLGRHS